MSGGNVGFSLACGTCVFRIFLLLGSESALFERRARIRARRTVNFGNFRGLDSLRSESYLRLIPIHRLTGGALVRASAFRLEMGVF
jgi:hypothetical protein